MTSYLICIVLVTTESQLQTSEGGIEIVPADNGQSVIYHCIGPSTSMGKTVSDSERPEAHHYDNFNNTSFYSIKLPLYIISITESQ